MDRHSISELFDNSLRRAYKDHTHNGTYYPDDFDNDKLQRPQQFYRLVLVVCQDPGGRVFWREMQANLD